jgi:hypothetical protein
MLTYFLKPGGSLLVVDLLGGHSHHQHHHHEADHMHGGHGEGHNKSLFPEHVHHFVPHIGGLDKSAMQKAFEGAGLGSFSFEHAMDVMKNGQEAELFIAKGIKPVV